MHIDSYKIFSYGTTWKNGKESKEETIKHMLTSDECIRGKQLIRLLEELEETWESFRICSNQISLGSLTTPTMTQFQKKSIKPLCDL